MSNPVPASATALPSFAATKLRRTCDEISTARDFVECAFSALDDHPAAGNGSVLAVLNAASDMLQKARDSIFAVCNSSYADALRLELPAVPVDDEIPLLAKLEAMWRFNLQDLAKASRQMDGTATAEADSEADSLYKRLIEQENDLSSRIAAEPANSLGELAFKARVVIRNTIWGKLSDYALCNASDFPSLADLALDHNEAAAASLALDLIRLAEKGEQA